jgi:transposase-like protein
MKMMAHRQRRRTDRVEIIPSDQRRRRWTASEKIRIVEETFEPGMTVSLGACRHGVLRTSSSRDAGW